MTGLLLINLGTPSAPTVPAVRRYLREFLSDPAVIDLPSFARWLLLNLVILPFRSKRSAAAYQKIWTAEGSPLWVNMNRLTKEVARELGNTPVEMAFRYGPPSIEEGCDRLLKKGATKIRALPLYPQYASSSTGSVVTELEKFVNLKMRSQPVSPEVETGGSAALEIIPPFYRHPGFIKSWVVTGQPYVKEGEHVLFSFHGLPKREVKSDAYRAACLETARLIAEGLHLKDYSVSFQSRLGPIRWLPPYTDHLLKELARKGKKRVVVFCPSFVSDCLETLEEIGIRGRETFLKEGGESLKLVPSLNTHPLWIKTIVDFSKT